MAFGNVETNRNRILIVCNILSEFDVDIGLLPNVKIKLRVLLPRRRCRHASTVRLAPFSLLDQQGAQSLSVSVTLQLTSTLVSY